jgi:hypothetical protein
MNNEQLTTNKPRRLPILNLDWHDTGKNQIYCRLADGKIMCSYSRAWQRTHFRLTIYFGKVACIMRNCATEELAKRTAEDILLILYKGVEDAIKF